MSSIEATGTGGKCESHSETGTRAQRGDDGAKNGHGQSSKDGRSRAVGAECDGSDGTDIMKGEDPAEGTHSNGNFYGVPEPGPCIVNGSTQSICTIPVRPIKVPNRLPGVPPRQGPLHDPLMMQPFKRSVLAPWIMQQGQVSNCPLTMQSSQVPCPSMTTQPNRFTGTWLGNSPRLQYNPQVPPMTVLRGQYLQSRPYGVGGMPTGSGMLQPQTFFEQRKLMNNEVRFKESWEARKAIQEGEDIAQKADRAAVRQENGRQLMEQWRSGDHRVAFAYPWGSEPMWSCKTQTRPSTDVSGELSTRAKRCSQLLAALRVDHEELNMARNDQQYARNLAQNPYYHAQADALKKRSAVGHFWCQQTPPFGLVVNGCDPNHIHGYPSSNVSFLALHAHALNLIGGIPLTHITALHQIREYSAEGVLGLLRSLCTQLLVAYRNTLNLYFVDFPYLYQLRHHADAMVLCNIFREIVCDIAVSVVKKKHEKKLHAIVIDGLDLLEADPRFEDVAVFLRALCNEVEFGELGEYFEFKYALIHPQDSRLCPYAAEAEVRMDQP